MGDSRVYDVLLSFGVSGLGEVALWKDKPKYVTMNKEEGKLKQTFLHPDV